MKTILQINGKDTEVTLTEEQIKRIATESGLISTDITERVKTFSDVLMIARNRKDLRAIVSEYDSAGPIAEKYLMLVLITAVLNEGWEPDWNDHGQGKHYPWFKQVGSGSGFAFFGYDFVHSFAYVGSRLCFKNRELAEYAGKQFEYFYNDYLNMQSQ